MQFTNVNVEDHFNSKSSLNILYYGTRFKNGIDTLFSKAEFTVSHTSSLTELKKHTQSISFHDINTIILIEVEPLKFDEIQEYVFSLKSNFLTKNLITIFLLTEPN
ncbi:MAG TPA: sugar transferase, partial [Pelobium sp.]